MSEPLWGLYRIFLAVLEEGSLSGAARTLGLTQPTIGRQIEALEQALWEGLRGFEKRAGVQDVRVKGAIGVVELDSNAENNQRMRQEFIARGTWLRPFGNCLYLMPPLTIGDAELEKIFAAISAVLK